MIRGVGRRVLMMGRGVLALAVLCVVTSMTTGCGGGGTSIIGGLPASPIKLDAGQSITLTASVVNDQNNAGVTWALSGVGSLSNAVCAPISASTQCTIVYTTPSSNAAGASATVVATSIHTPSQSVTFSINIGAAVVITSPATLPNGTVGLAYATTLTATGGAGTLTFSITSGSLPPGLTLAQNGAITGKPSTAGTYTFVIQVSDASSSVPAGPTQTESITIVPTPPVVTTTLLPSGEVGVPYSQQLTFSGGTGVGTFSITSGALPAGLTLTSGGLISGTPLASAGATTSNFSVQVVSGTQTSPARPLSIRITLPPTVSTTTLPTGTVNTPYAQQLAFTGGNGGAVSWSYTGTLPTGLMLSTSGLISGTPSALGTFNFIVTVTVGGQASAPQSLSLTISNLSITTGTTAYGEVGLAFNFPEAVKGGIGPYTWTLATGSNALPAGLTLNSTTGTISGNPTVAATTSITVQVTDSTGSFTTQAITLIISPARTSAKNSELLGQYAFVLSGADASGYPIAAAGNFTATGAGAISGGTLDLNGTAMATPALAQPLTASTYSIGADGRGKLTLSTASKTYVFVIALRNSAGASSGGYMNEFDATGQTLSGLIALQDPTSFTTASLNGGYALGLEGFVTSGTTHVGLVGELQITGATGASTGEVTTTLLGANAIPATGSEAVLPTGRGLLNLTLTGGQQLMLVVYPVSAKQLLLLTANTASATAPVMSGQALAQTIANGNFALSSLNGVAVTRAERGVDTTSTPQSDVLLGLTSFNGTGTASFTGDENAAGTIASVSTAGSYAVAANGRATYTLSGGIGGCVNCTSLQTVTYLAGVNQGFSLDFSAGAATGTLEPQSAGPFSATTLSGNYALGSVQPISSATLTEGVATITVGSAALTLDTNTASLLAADVPLTLTTTTSTSGRIAATGSDGSSLAIYIVSSTRAIALNLSTTQPVEEELQQ